jgi:hypothetical protein
MPTIDGPFADHRAAIGYAYNITGLNKSQVSASLDLVRTNFEKSLVSMGALATGTYWFFLPTAGAQAIDVIIAGTSTGTGPTLTMYPVKADGLTQKGSTTTAVTFGSTDTITSITTLRGEPGVMLKVSVPAASTATFTTAEYSAL